MAVPITTKCHTKSIECEPHSSNPLVEEESYRLDDAIMDEYADDMG